MRLFCLYLIAFVIGLTPLQKSKIITFTGITGNAFRGAVVEDDSSKRMYYLDGISEWPEKVLGKRVQVTGQLVITDTRKDTARKIPVQEIIGLIYRIKHPRWKLIN